MPWRDLWVYLQALRRHFGGLVGGTFVAFVLILWDDVLHLGNIPEGVWMIVAVLGVFISGFNAWRAEHGKVVDRNSTRLNSSHGYISYAVFCLKKKNTAMKYAEINNPDISYGATSVIFMP